MNSPPLCASRVLRAWLGRTTQFQNLSYADLGYAVALAFTLQSGPKASAQTWSFFLECGQFSDKEQANHRVKALGVLGLPISVRREPDENGKMRYELIVKGMDDAEEAQRTRLLIERSGGPHCKSELDR